MLASLAQEPAEHARGLEVLDSIVKIYTVFARCVDGREPGSYASQSLTSLAAAAPPGWGLRFWVPKPCTLVLPPLPGPLTAAVAVVQSLGFLISGQLRAELQMCCTLQRRSCVPIGAATEHVTM